MPRHVLQHAIEDLHARYRSSTDGHVATYIPELGLANPDDFGISLVTAAGEAFETGDHCRPFTIQSISKPFTFGLALEELEQRRSRAGSASSRAATRSTRSSSRVSPTGRTIRWSTPARSP